MAVAIALGLCACVGALAFYLDVMTKRCWNCRRRLRRSAMLCTYCGKWWQNEKARQQLDLFDQAQLAFVIRICRESATLSDAGRKLFAASRGNRKTANDADRLRKYLARFQLDWSAIK